MTVTIAVVSGKGGTGKTTTAISLACALAERGFDVLAVDMDPQANLTSGLGFNPYDARPTLRQVLAGDSTAESAILDTPYGVDLLPCRPDLAAIEAALPSRIGREFVLRDALRTLHDYNFALIDTPPNFGFHTTNALVAADYILVPVQMSGYALKGLVEVQRAVTAMRTELNPGLQVLGVLPTFVTPRTNFSYDILAGLRALPDLRVFEAQVRSTVRFAETSLKGVPILRYASRSGAANAYRKLAGEVVDRVGVTLPDAGVAALLTPSDQRSQADESPPWPALTAVSPTGALSVDAATLLGMAPLEGASHAAAAISSPRGRSAAIGARSDPKEPSSGALRTVWNLVRRLTRR